MGVYKPPLTSHCYKIIERGNLDYVKLRRVLSLLLLRLTINKGVFLEKRQSPKNDCYRGNDKQWFWMD